MFQLFGQRQPKVLGIDIDTTSVRLLELSEDGAHYRIDSYGVEYLPDGAMAGKDIEDVAAVGAAIAKLVNRVRPSCIDAAVALPASAVITKTIQLPKSLSEEEIEAQIHLDAESYIPFPIHEVSIDFQVLGPHGDDKHIDVLLVAAKTEYVDSRFEAVELGGLKTKIVDSEIYAIERAFSLINHDGVTRDAAQPELVAIFDIGATVTTLNVLENHHTIYSREQNFGGLALIENIQATYGMSFQEAVIAKKEQQLPDTYEALVLQPFRESCVQQVNRSLQLFFSSAEQHHVNKIVLAGTSANLDQLVEMVHESLGVDVIVADLSQGIHVGKTLRQKLNEEDFSSLLICCGLAMRSFS